MGLEKRKNLPCPTNANQVSYEPLSLRFGSDPAFSTCNSGWAGPEHSHWQSHQQPHHRWHYPSGKQKVSRKHSGWKGACWTEIRYNPPAGSSSERFWPASPCPGPRKCPGIFEPHSPTKRIRSNAGLCRSIWIAAWAHRSPVSWAQWASAGPPHGWRLGIWAQPSPSDAWKLRVWRDVLLRAQTRCRIYQTENNMCERNIFLKQSIKKLPKLCNNMAAKMHACMPSASKHSSDHKNPSQRFCIVWLRGIKKNNTVACYVMTPLQRKSNKLATCFTRGGNACIGCS